MVATLPLKSLGGLLENSSSQIICTALFLPLGKRAHSRKQAMRDFVISCSMASAAWQETKYSSISSRILSPWNTENILWRNIPWNGNLTTKASGELETHACMTILIKVLNLNSGQPQMLSGL